MAPTRKRARPASAAGEAVLSNAGAGGALLRAGPRGLPLYERVKESIDRRIREDHWSPRFQLPSDDILAREFDASRLTVQRALRELQTEGLLVRIQGRGTFVVGPRMQCAIFALRDLAEEIEESGGVHTNDVVTHCVLGGGDPRVRLLAADFPAPVFHSRIVHREEGIPFSSRSASSTPPRLRTISPKISAPRPPAPNSCARRRSARSATRSAPSAPTRRRARCSRSVPASPASCSIGAHGATRFR